MNPIKAMLQAVICGLLLITILTPWSTQAVGTDTWHNVYEPNTSNNNFKFNNTWPYVNTRLWENGNQHIDLNISKVSIRTLTGSFSGKIYAHVMPWFDGNNPSKHLLPGYHSADPAVVDRQISDMISRGLDGVIINWYGQGTYADQTTLVWRDRILARGLGNRFVLSIMIDKGALSGCSTDCTSRLNRHIRDYIIPTYENRMGSAYMRDGAGRPIIYFFDVQQNYPSIDWASVRYWASSRSGVSDHIFMYEGSAGLDPTRVPAEQADGAFAWIDVNTTSYSYLRWWYGLSRNGRISIGSAYKGFDDAPVLWGPGGIRRFVDQRCGQTWLDSFKALREAPTAATALQLNTWNDYEEGTALEIGIDNCLSAINISRSGSTVSWTLSWNGGSSSTIHHVTVWARAANTSTMYNCSGDLPTSVASYNLANCALPAGTYQIYVQAVGQPFIKNKLSPVPSPVSYTR
ncbi:MAG TPA: hypothetical protein VFZ66_23755 [Herpetosiphonaceae bacterium]